MAAALDAMANIDLGYPRDENRIYPSSDESLLERLASVTGLAPQSALMSFYRCCGGASLPDIHVGYFIHSPELVLRGLERGEPRRLTGLQGRSILVFGSDGGGGRFALGAAGDGDVLYLGEGAVHDGVFDGVGGENRLVSTSLDAFLTRLLDDTEAFVRGDADWAYVALGAILGSRR